MKKMSATPNTASINKPRKVRIFFGDLVHTWEKTSMWVAPLNVGLIGAYAKKVFGDEIEVIANDTRSQHRNREIARERLIERIESALVVDKPRRATKPSKASKTRRLEAKKARGDTKRGRHRPSIDD